MLQVWLHTYRDLYSATYTCLLTSMELILMPNINLLHSHSNDMNCLRFLKKVIGSNIMLIAGRRDYKLKYNAYSRAEGL